MIEDVTFEERGEEGSEKEPLVFNSTWDMEVRSRPANEFLTEWKRKGRTPPGVLIPPNHVIGLRPEGLTPDNFATWANFLDKVERIYYLNLSGANITDESLKSLSRLHLEELDLSETAITNNGLAYLKNNPGLMSLNLGNCQWISDEGLRHIQDLTHLTRLYLKNLRVSNTGLDYLRRLFRLTHLVLRGTNISGTGLLILEGLYNLRYLDISRTQIDDAGLLPICRFRYLETLLLEGCKIITKAGVAHLTCLIRLRKLGLSDSNITDESLEHIKKLTSLEELTLARCWRVTRRGINTVRRPGLRIVLGGDNP